MLPHLASGDRASSGAPAPAKPQNQKKNNGDQTITPSPGNASNSNAVRTPPPAGPAASLPRRPSGLPAAPAQRPPRPAAPAARPMQRRAARSLIKNDTGLAKARAFMHNEKLCVFRRGRLCRLLRRAAVLKVLERAGWSLAGAISRELAPLHVTSGDPGASRTGLPRPAGPFGSGGVARVGAGSPHRPQPRPRAGEPRRAPGQENIQLHSTRQRAPGGRASGLRRRPRRWLGAFGFERGAAASWCVSRGGGD